MQSAHAEVRGVIHCQPVAPREDSDQALLQAIAAGDRLAMRSLYRRHHVRVYRFVLRIVGDPSKCEDVVSDVFFQVWRHAGRFEGRSQVSTWLLAMARYKAYSLLRQRQEEAIDDAAAEQAAKQVADEANDPLLTLEKKDTGALLRRCLRELSPEHREIIDLVYYHEKSVREAAVIVGVPCNTVKTRMFYARRQMRALLTQAGALNAA